jgi:hypothetical protein
MNTYDLKVFKYLFNKNRMAYRNETLTTGRGT